MDRGYPDFPTDGEDNNRFLESMIHLDWENQTSPM